MMIRKKLYPSTKRIGANTDLVYITEKLDGSNLGLFRFDLENLLIAQRNNFFLYNPKEGLKNGEGLYMGLLYWLEKYGEELLESLHIGSGVFGEWLHKSGNIKYHRDRLEKSFYIFAKANITEDLENMSIRNLYYQRDLLLYPFVYQTLPDFMDLVPLVMTTEDKNISISELDEIYERYVSELNYGEPFSPDLPNKVEGFVISVKNDVTKYVRYKNKKFEPHTIKY